MIFLILLGNDIESEGMKYLSQSFQYLSSLQSLEIWGNLLELTENGSLF
jgi:hypothetical protein